MKHRRYIRSAGLTVLPFRMLVRAKGFKAPRRDFYHYTSFENFKNIVASGEFWATEYSALNDAEEIKYSMKLLLDQVEGLLDAKLKEEMFSYIEHEVLPSIGNDIFIISFSRVGSLLSQWRAYAPQEGVSLGISHPALLLAELKIHFLANWVQYGSNGSGLDFIVVLEALARHLHAHSLTADQESEFKKWVLEAVIEEAVFIKHPAFIEEQEFRIAFFPQFNKNFSVEMHPEGTKRVVKLPIVSEMQTRTEFPFSEVIVGPSDNTFQRMEDVENVLRDNKMGSYMVTACGIPLQ